MRESLTQSCLRLAKPIGRFLQMSGGAATAALRRPSGSGACVCVCVCQGQSPVGRGPCSGFLSAPRVGLTAQGWRAPFSLSCAPCCWWGDVSCCGAFPAFIARALPTFLGWGGCRPRRGPTARRDEESCCRLCACGRHSDTVASRRGDLTWRRAAFVT